MLSCELVFALRLLDFSFSIVCVSIELGEGDAVVFASDSSDLLDIFVSKVWVLLGVLLVQYLWWAPRQCQITVRLSKIQLCRYTILRDEDELPDWILSQRPLTAVRHSNSQGSIGLNYDPTWRSFLLAYLISVAVALSFLFVLIIYPQFNGRGQIMCSKFNTYVSID